MLKLNMKHNPKINLTAYRLRLVACDAKADAPDHGKLKEHQPQVI